MPKFRKKPVEIEARQYCRNNSKNILDWLNSEGCDAYLIPDELFTENDAILIPTLEGDHRANIGDFIIKGIAGEFYPCKSAIFAQTYDSVA